MNSRHHRGFAFGIVVAAHLLVASPAAAQEVVVDVVQYTYAPNPVVVPMGTTITWVNKDFVAHTVTADDRTVFDSDLFSRGESWSWTFDTPGVYGYYCVPHGSPGSGMIGVVEVFDPNAPPMVEEAPVEEMPVEEVPPAEEAPPVE